MLFQLKTATAGPQSGDRGRGRRGVCERGSAREVPQIAWSQVYWAPARLSSGTVGLRNEGSREGKRGLAGNVASCNLEKQEDASWHSHIYLVRQPRMGH